MLFALFSLSQAGLVGSPIGYVFELTTSSGEAVARVLVVGEEAEGDGLCGTPGAVWNADLDALSSTTHTQTTATLVSVGPCNAQLPELADFGGAWAGFFDVDPVSGTWNGDEADVCSTIQGAGFQAASLCRVPSSF